MIETHTIENISFKEESLILIIDKREIIVLLEKISSKLKSANDLQRSIYTISPSGYGIHWPLIDEDLSVDSILKQFG